MKKYNPEKDRANLAVWRDPVLEEERTWIVGGEEGLEEADNQDKGKGKAKVVDGAEEEPELEDGEGIECQCCFCEYPFVCSFIYQPHSYKYSAHNLTGQNGSMPRSPSFLHNLHFSICRHATRFPLRYTRLHAPFRV